MMPFTLPAKKEGVLMVWQGTIVQTSEESKAAKVLQGLLNLKTPPQIFGCTETLPDPGAPEGITGGRVDLIFAIDQSDVQTAAACRLGYDDLKWACDMDRRIYVRDVRALIEGAAF